VSSGERTDPEAPFEGKKRTPSWRQRRPTSLSWAHGDHPPIQSDGRRTTGQHQRPTGVTPWCVRGCCCDRQPRTPWSSSSQAGQLWRRGRRQLLGCRPLDRVDSSLGMRGAAQKRLHPRLWHGAIFPRAGNRSSSVFVLTAPLPDLRLQSRRLLLNCRDCRGSSSIIALGERSFPSDRAYALVS
jgi:hypothetical protein